MGTKPASERAFTLLELLIATGILAMLVVVLAQIASFVASAWTAGNGNVERRGNVRALTEFIGRELQAAIVPITGTAVAGVPNLQFVSNPSSVNYNYPSSLFWQAPVATDTTYGDLAEVGYFVRWGTSGGRPQANLCRFFLNPGQTSVYSSTNWITSGTLDAVASANSANGYAGLFAENVVGFWARCFKADGTEISAHESFDSKTAALPSKIEISLVLLDSRSAARMTSAIQNKLIQIVQSKVCVNAAECVAAIQADPIFKPISGGACAYTTMVYLENSK